MSNLLLLETAQDVCSVAIADGTGLLALVEVEGRHVHAERLTLLVREAMDAAGLTFAGLSGVGVSEGPGSYTGLRIGVATAKGFCYGLDIPLYGIGSLKALYYAARQKAGAVEAGTVFCPMLDARRMEVYCAAYHLDGKELLPVKAAVVPDEFPVEGLTDRPVVFFGNGMPKCREILAEKCPRAYFLDDIKPSAAWLREDALARHTAGQAENLLTYEPYYLKEFRAGTPGAKLRRLLHG